jgi:predicted outer membrane repeat protein
MGSKSLRTGLVAGVLLIAQGAGPIPAGPAQPAAAAVIVPCDATALVNAITVANGAGSKQLLTLASSCTYNLTQAAATGTRGPNGLPIITGNIEITGYRTIIRRSSPDLFRLIEVAGTLSVANGVTLIGGDAGPHTGGAILNSQGTVSVVSATIRNNVADNGAAISNDRGQFTLSGTSIRANSTVPSSGGGGGAIYNDGTMTVSTTSLLNNVANTSGGAIYNERTGTLKVTDSEVLANDAALRGGGLYNGVEGEATFTNTTINGNTAGTAGGGIYNAACKCSIALTTTTVTLNAPDDCRPLGSVAGCSG